MTELSAIAATALLSAAPLAAGIGYLSAKRPHFGLLRFLLAVATGFAAVIPAAITQLLFPPLSSSGVFSLAGHAFAVIALTEEGAKYLSVRALRKRWGEPGNSVPAGMAASLGFGFIETIVYASANPSAVFVRAVTAAPLHAACGAWIGKAASDAAPAPGRAGYFAAAVIVHGAYDLGLLVYGFPIIVPVLIAIGGLALALSQLKTRRSGEN